MCARSPWPEILQHLTYFAKPPASLGVPQGVLIMPPEPLVDCLLEEGSASELVDALEAVGKVRELLDAVIDTALVLVDVGPSVPGGAKRGNVSSRRGRDASVFQLDEHLAAREGTSVRVKGCSDARSTASVQGT
mmetsp:Transcript_12040/g.18882  ORF Transcript_12040/g.18882 Transcript_12040/m.18882 type:complete len:134 (+) Transcript_12040:116-517(+)